MPTITNEPDELGKAMADPAVPADQDLHAQLEASGLLRDPDDPPTKLEREAAKIKRRALRNGWTTKHDRARGTITVRTYEGGRVVWKRTVPKAQVQAAVRRGQDPMAFLHSFTRVPKAATSRTPTAVKPAARPRAARRRRASTRAGPSDDSSESGGDDPPPDHAAIARLSREGHGLPPGLIDPTLVGRVVGLLSCRSGASS